MPSLSPAIYRRIALLVLPGCIAVASRAAEPASKPAGSAAAGAAATAPAPVAKGETKPSAQPQAEQAADDRSMPAPNPLLDGPNLGALPNAAPSPPSPNATVNLIRLLVAKKVLSAEEAKQMIEQAEAEALAARQEAEANKVAAAGPDDVRVTYVPDVVKDEMREQIKADLVAEARAEKWTMPDAGAADWTRRIKLFGDLRLRFEADMFPSGNDNTGAFPNFNSINTGSPFDVSGTQFSPQYNVDKQRNRVKLRARLGADIDLEDGWSGGIRFGTGETGTPISQNQTLGAANNGQGGNFSKYQLWLDRAFIRYEHGNALGNDVVVNFGRFDNPFFSTTAIWADEIGFDGFSARGQAKLNDRIKVFAVGGAFPVFNTDFNFPNTSPSKFKSSDKWLYAAQLGLDFKVTNEINAKVAAAYYDFDNVEGRLSSPFIPLTTLDQGDTDDTRPSFAKKGNTYRALRNIIPSVVNNFGTSSQYQYFGLASKFRDAAFTGRIDFNNWEPYQLSLIGEYIQNTAFDKSAINTVAVNNRGPNNATGGVGAFDGSDKAWLLRAQFGKQAFEKAWDWNVSVDYRYLGSDSVMDAFNDDDFGLGGTNQEGFTVGGQVALSKRLKLGLRWFSATQLVGPQFKSDIFMVDINAKF